MLHIAFSLERTECTGENWKYCTQHKYMFIVNVKIEIVNKYVDIRIDRQNDMISNNIGFSLLYLCTKCESCSLKIIWVIVSQRNVVTVGLFAYSCGALVSPIKNCGFHMFVFKFFLYKGFQNGFDHHINFAVNFIIYSFGQTSLGDEQCGWISCTRRKTYREFFFSCIREHSFWRRWRISCRTFCHFWLLTGMSCAQY